jgi:aspartate-semialdehyde dehydrogenase
MDTFRPLHLGVAGATGLVGREFLDLLERRDFPIASLRLFASARSAGQKMTVRGREITVEEFASADPANLDVVLLSAGKRVAAEQAPRFAEAGVVVVDNSSAFREDPEIPLIVPEVNGEALDAWALARRALDEQEPLPAGGHSRPRRRGGIIANPNCTAIVLVLPLAPLHRALGIEELVVSTYQAVSGAGKEARDELLDQARAFALGEPETWHHYDRPIFLNVIPKIGDWSGAGDCFEEVKVVRETRRILGEAKLPVYVTAVRVPVERCHSESVFARLRWPVTEEEVHEILAQAPGVQLMDLPTPRELARREQVFVGRVRVGPDDQRVVRMWIVGDQLWKGAALNAIQIAERLAASGFFEPRVVAART